MQPEKHNDIDKRLSRLYAAPVPESFETGWRADIRREESMNRMNELNKRGLKPMWRKFVPALCALVLVIGGLWTGALNAGTQQASMEADNVYMSSASRAKANWSLMAAEESYDMASGAYDAGVVTFGAQAQDSRKLVRTADLTMRTKAFDSAVEQVKQKLAEAGGYIENLYQSGESSRRLNVSLRVPALKLDDFLASLEGAGRVTDRSESTVDMTVQYTDNQARLDTLYQKRDRLNQLMEKAEDISDLIEIEGAIADTQYQIDSYETSQRSIDRQVDMSAVNLTLIEEKQTVVNPELTLGERIRAGFTDSIRWLMDFGRDVLVFTVMASPVAALIAALWLCVRLIRKIKTGGNKP